MFTSLVTVAILHLVLLQDTPRISSHSLKRRNMVNSLPSLDDTTLWIVTSDGNVSRLPLMVLSAVRVRQQRMP